MLPHQRWDWTHSRMSPERTPSAQADERDARRSGEIHLRIPGLRQLFDPMDPSPVTGKDLHPRVEEYIISWGREIPGKTDLALVIHIDQPVSDTDARAAASVIHAFFEERARVTRRSLRGLFRVGRISLSIALVVLFLSIAAGELLRPPAQRWWGRSVAHSRLAGGWPCGDRSRHSYTTGGPSARMFGSSTDWLKWTYG